MIKRLTTSLFSPKEIIYLRVDRFGKLFLYFLILCLFMVIPTTVKAVKVKGLDFNAKIDIENAFANKEVPYKIIDNKLVATTSVTCTDYVIDNNFMVTFSTVELAKPTAPTILRFVFSESGVKLCIYGFENYGFSTSVFEYTDYPSLNGINFNDATSIANNDFWNVIFKVCQSEFDKYAFTVKAFTILESIIVNLMTLLLICLLFAFVQRMGVRGIISFKENYVMAGYSLTPFAIGSLFAMLFNFQIFYYIGIVLSVIYNIVSTNTLIRSISFKK